ncbi:MAG: hypothetical protein NUW37_01550 [Planctomycetes bacterium]|nr:hypothetical protein [Planctomycetota bacterium]
MQSKLKTISIFAMLAYVFALGATIIHFPAGETYDDGDDHHGGDMVQTGAHDDDDCAVCHFNASSKSVEQYFSDELEYSVRIDVAHVIRESDRVATRPTTNPRAPPFSPVNS